MLQTLHSEFLTVMIESKGAELFSIKNKEGYEYLWQANPAIWGRRAPVLFPIVGKLKNNQYNFQSHTYTLPQHGFARDMEFKAIKANENELSFELYSSEDTKKNYPFGFRLVLGYALIKNRIRCSFSVENTGKSTMFFSVGAHPAFNINAQVNSTNAWPCLEFDIPSLSLSQLNSGLISKNKTQLHLPDKRISIHPQLFKNDALVLENNQIRKARLIINDEGRGVEITCEEWPYFGVWSKPNPNTGNLNFICLEPWHGIADFENSEGFLENKAGILLLEKEKQFDAAFELGFY